MSKPITPDEADKRKQDSVPSFVIEIFNELILQKWDGYCAIIKGYEAADHLKERARLEGVTYQAYWLDIEPAYRSNGWECDYDKPGYNETYDGFYTFKKKVRE
jgi:hypothetical protein